MEQERNERTPIKPQDNGVSVVNVSVYPADPVCLPHQVIALQAFTGNRKDLDFSMPAEKWLKLAKDIIAAHKHLSEHPEEEALAVVIRRVPQKKARQLILPDEQLYK